MKEAAADLLFGMFYANPKLTQYRQKVQTLPVANVPRQFREGDPNLKYLASHQLSSDGSHIMVGDHVLGLSQTRYRGWSELKNSVKVMLQVARGTQLIGSVERYSLKALNVLPVEYGSALEKINGKFEIAGRIATDKGFHFRTEFTTEQVTTIVEITTNAKVAIDNQVRAGMLITLDTIQSANAESIWSDLDSCLEKVHWELKSLFFNLLTEETIESFGPTWRPNGLPSSTDCI